MGYQEKLFTLIAQWPFAMSFVIMLLLISMKLQFKNKVMSFVGKIALELYMIHALFIILCREWFANDILFVACTYAFSIATAIILHYLDGKIVKMFKGKKVKRIL